MFEQEVAQLCAHQASAMHSVWLRDAECETQSFGFVALSSRSCLSKKGFRLFQIGDDEGTQTVSFKEF